MKALHRIPAWVSLAVGWLGFMAYAFPGYMSYDSVLQLLEARAGEYSEGHPPVMAATWSIVDYVIAGPIGMLVIQSVCFLGGVYLIMRSRMSAKLAAPLASLILWFPIVSTTMAVIWKDSQMAGYLALGTGLLLSPRRGPRVVGLAMIWMATAMRWNALAMTLPIVTILFVWNPAYRWWKRYSISVAAWLAITLSVQVASAALVTRNAHLWQSGMALLDIVGTLRYAPDLTDAEIKTLLDGCPLVPSSDLQAKTRIPIEDWNFAAELWDVTNGYFKVPSNEQERLALSGAWKRVVIAHPKPYLTYRWKIFAQVLQLPDVPEANRGSAIYQWFTDIQDPVASGQSIEHTATSSKLQEKLRQLMWWLGSTRLFQAYIYFFLAIALLAFCFRDRESFGLLMSGLVGESALFIVAPITDWRYSFWLVVSTCVALALLIARRARPRRGGSLAGTPLAVYKLERDGGACRDVGSGGCLQRRQGDSRGGG